MFIVNTGYAYTFVNIHLHVYNKTLTMIDTPPPLFIYYNSLYYNNFLILAFVENDMKCGASIGLTD